MAKFEAVDRLMAQATGPAQTADPSQPSTSRSAGEVLESSIEAPEPLPPPRSGVLLPPRRPAAPGVLSALGALRPLLPALGGALRLVDHSAARAALQLLPMLGAALGGPGKPQNPAPTPTDPGAGKELTELARQAGALAARIDAQAATLEELGDQLRKSRDLSARFSSEQQALRSKLDQLNDRVRLLSAVAVILVLLVIAEMVLLFVRR